MKRILFSILIFFALCPVVHSAGLGFVSALSARGATTPVYCTGAATCTATTPGSCELICEDMEGASECDSDSSPDMDASCRSGWSVINGTGVTSDFTTTHSGTMPCTDKGLYAVQFNTTSATQSYAMSKSFDADQAIVYGQIYFNILSLTLADGQTESILDVEDSASTDSLVDVNVTRSGANYYLSLRCDGCASSDVGGTNLTLDGTKWYRLGFEFDQTNDHATIYLDGVKEAERTDYTDTTAQRRIRIGGQSATYRAATTFSFQVDNIAVSATALPGACNQ